MCESRSGLLDWQSAQFIRMKFKKRQRNGKRKELPVIRLSTKSERSILYVAASSYRLHGRSLPRCRPRILCDGQTTLQFLHLHALDGLSHLLLGTLALPETPLAVVLHRDTSSSACCSIRFSRFILRAPSGVHWTSLPESCS